MFLEDYERLVKAVLDHEKEDAEEFCKILDDRAQDFPRYVLAVFNEQKCVANARAMLASGRWDTPRYQQAVEEADRNRRFQHDKSIQSAKELNFFCEKYGLPNICPEYRERYDYGTWFAEVTAESFLRGTNRTVNNPRLKRLDL